MDEVEILSRLLTDPRPCVLATVVNVKGHAYRKAGAFMFLYENEETAGSISPGCLEADLTERVAGVLRTGETVLVHYDMSGEDDPFWGASVGCGGEIHVLLEPVTGDFRECLTSAARELLEGRSVRLVRRLNGEGRRMRYELTEVPAGGVAEAAAASMSDSDGACVFDQTYVPKDRLIIFGAGDDSRSLAELAVRTGFKVVVADWRSGLCTPQRFPKAELAVGFPEALIASLDLAPRDYAVVMSHQMERDRELLELLAVRPLRYVGIMGSSVRIGRLLHQLHVPASFHYPVGLPIGAVGPEEIAVSIVAQLIRCKRVQNNVGSWEDAV
ncbi:XdhC family protein [Paenibacillus hamazuiensis]|uniref:XdhC family protein n=1 Tax=Paenibacillus hamazuiensis TaxID=2936508 RepID=UPI00200D3663|nr:XdhC family protein [Paenibacillus hamazuiensis]